MPSEPIYSPNFAESVSGKTLILDTCVLIAMSKNAAFAEFMEKLRGTCVFLSVIPVKNEFLAVADNQSEYNGLVEFLEGLKIVFLSPDIEHALDKDGSKISIALRRSKIKNPSYVDRLLLAVPYLYASVLGEMRLMTLNHTDVPLEFYERTDFIVWDNGANFSEVGLYALNQAKLKKIVAKI